MGVRIRQRMLNARDISQPIFAETELLEKLNQALCSFALNIGNVRGASRGTTQTIVRKKG